MIEINMIGLPTQELLKSQRPVELATGREIMTVTNDVLFDMRQNFAPKLPLGTVTKDYFISMLETIANDQRIELFDQDESSAHSLNDINGADQDEQSDIRIVLGTRLLKEREQAVQDVLSGAGINSITTNELNYAWTVSHELGHALEYAFATVAPRKQQGIFTTPQAIIDLAMRDGQTEWIKPSEDLYGAITEHERFAEGFSRLYIDAWLAGKGVPEEGREHILESMNRIRRDRYKEKASPQRLGYSQPYDFETMLTIMEKTSEWEKP